MLESDFILYCMQRNYAYFTVLLLSALFSRLSSVIVNSLTFHYNFNIYLQFRITDLMVIYHFLFLSRLIQIYRGKCMFQRNSRVLKLLDFTLHKLYLYTSFGNLDRFHDFLEIIQPRWLQRTLNYSLILINLRNCTKMIYFAAMMIRN